MSNSTVLLSGLAVLLLGTGLALYSPDADPPVLLVANKNGNSLYFVDPASGKVTDSVATGNGPHEVAAAPKAGRAYVANYAGGTISVIDVAERKVVEHWPLDGYERPHGIEVGPDEERVYVTAEDQQAVLELDASSGAVRRKMFTGKDGTHMLALTSHASTLYATSIGSGTLTTIDLDTGRVVSNIVTGKGAEGITLTPNDRAVWVTNRGEDTVSIFDPERGMLTETLSVEGFPIRVDVGPTGQYAIVSSARAGAVTIFDAQTYDPFARLETGDMPIGVLIPNEHHAYVANAGSGTVSVIDLKTLSVVDTIRAGREPDGMAYVPAK